MKFKYSILLLFISACLSCNKNNSTTTPSNTADSLKIGLIAYYPFNGNVKDESGNNYNLENDGAKPTEDRFGNTGKAYSFNGLNAKMVIPSMPKASSLKNFTISYWAQMDTLGYVMSFLSNPDYRCDYSTSISVLKDLQGNYISENDVLVSDTTSSCNTRDVPFITTDPIGKWMHFVLVQQYVDSGTYPSHYVFSNYANGGACASYFSTGSENNPKPVTFEFGGALGCYMYNEFNGIQNIYFLKGKIDDVRIYNRALSENDIKKLYTLPE